jgi:hypothetical protein
MEKLEAPSVPLRTLATNVFQGLITSADAIYHLTLVSRQKDGKVQARNRDGEELVLESGLLKPLLAGKNIDRYSVDDTGQLLLFPYQVFGGKATLISVEEMVDKFPATWEYLNRYESALRGRERGKMDHERWYAYVYPKSLALHDLRKLAVPRLVHRLEAHYDANGEYYLDNVDVGGVILKDDSTSHYLFVLGLLNSTLIDWYFRQISTPFRGGFRSANRQFIDPLPIRQIDSSNNTDQQLHDAIVARVQEMLSLQSQLAPLRHAPSSLRSDLLHEVERVDRQIDQLVYQLHGLTAQEIQIVARAR